MVLVDPLGLALRFSSSSTKLERAGDDQSQTCQMGVDIHHTSSSAVDLGQRPVSCSCSISSSNKSWILDLFGGVGSGCL